MVTRCITQRLHLIYDVINIWSLKFKFLVSNIKEGFQLKHTSRLKSYSSQEEIFSACQGVLSSRNEMETEVERRLVISACYGVAQRRRVVLFFFDLGLSGLYLPRYPIYKNEVENVF